MFHEYRDLITKLKHKDNHFTRLFDEHNSLDEEIDKLEKNPIAAHRHDEIEEKKRRKLQLKDEIFNYLKSVAEKS